MKQRTRIPLAVPAHAPTFVNAPRLERRRTIFDLFRQFCGVLALLAMGMAQAAPVTYYFGGQLSWVHPDLSPTLSVGNEFNGTFTYESTTVDSSPADPNRGYYAPGPAFAVTINALTFSIAGGGSGSVSVVNDLSGTDKFDAASAGSATTGSINDYIPYAFFLLMDDYTGSAFISDALPAFEVDLALFDVSGFELFLENRGALDSGASIHGSLSYLSLTAPNATSIPEPGSLALLGLALAATLPPRVRIVVAPIESTNWGR